MEPPNQAAPAPPGKGCQEQDPIKQKHPTQADLACQENPAGQLRQPFHCPDGVGDERPCQVGHRLPQRLGDQAKRHRQAAQDHHRWLGRQDQRVGNQRRQRKALKMVGDHRQRGHQRRQGEEQVFPEGPGQLLSRFRGQPQGNQAGNPLHERICVQHQPQGRHERELEAHIPQDKRAEQRHQGRGEGQAVEPSWTANRPSTPMIAARTTDAPAPTSRV